MVLANVARTRALENTTEMHIPHRERASKATWGAGQLFATAVPDRQHPPASDREPDDSGADDSNSG
jgi:hypothetical protein